MNNSKINTYLLTIQNYYQQFLFLRNYNDGIDNSMEEKEYRWQYISKKWRKNLKKLFRLEFFRVS